VMGDHRSDSADSRAHLGDPGGGMVRLDDVVGRAGMIYRPPSRLTLLRAPTLSAPHSPDSLAGIPAGTVGEEHP
jgi:signal peptidase I